MGMTPPVAVIFIKGTLDPFAANSSLGNLAVSSTGQVSDYRQGYARPDNASESKVSGRNNQ